MPPIKKNEKASGPMASVESLYVEEEKIEDRSDLDKFKTYVSFTRSMAKSFRSYGKGKKFTPDFEEVFGFLAIDVTAEDYYAACRGALIIAAAIGSVLAMAVFFFLNQRMETMYAMGGAFFALMIPIGAAIYYQYYPKMAADKEKMLALAYVPEIVNYLVMSMRLNPNLERAVEFAALHGRGRIAEEMKKIIWGVQIGQYSSVEEALDNLAYRWGPYSDDFKQALMTIRASVLETDKTRRAELFEKAVEDVLEGSKEKMDLYARGLHQPTVFLYYFGILLPLMLAIILPIGAAFLKDASFAKAEYVFTLYCVILPAMVYMYGNSILSGRPPTYVPPEIPENYPGLPKRGMMAIGGIQLPYKFLAFFAFVLIISAGYFADEMRFASIATYQREDVLKATAHVDLPIFGRIYALGIFGVLIGTAVGISIYLWGKYAARKKVQDDIREMEVEFKDAVYVLASRLGENRPMEEAIRSAIEFLPRSKVAKRVFRTVLENISMLGMTVDAAVFDRTYGALKNLPSQTIRSGMRVMVDSVEIGVNVAAKSLISLSMQIRNSHKIDEMLKRLLSDITVLLNTMSVFVAPIVLAVVSSLQTVIINSLSSVGGDSSNTISTQTSSSLPMSSMAGLLGNKNLAAQSASPGQFMFIMGIYLMEIVILLIYFNSQIEDSNNKLHTYTSIAKALPIATIIFSVVAFFAGSSLAAIGG